MVLAIVLTVLGVCAANLASLTAFVWWQNREAMRAVSQEREVRAQRTVATDPAIVEAVRSACLHIGLAGEQLGPSFDLVRTGKLYDVLHHAAVALGKDHELRTIADVCDWLRDAPSC